MTTHYKFSAEQAIATGHPTSERKFLVHKGSTAMKCGSPNEKRDRADRDSLVRRGILVEHKSHSGILVFTCDYEFSSPSKAGGIIRDGNCSGPQAWINTSTGASLKEDRAARKP